jgi:hypothetical protein
VLKTKRKLKLLEQLNKTRGYSYDYDIGDLTREDHDYMNKVTESWILTNLLYKDLIDREILFLKREIRLKKIKLIKNDN